MEITNLRQQRILARAEFERLEQLWQLGGVERAVVDVQEKILNDILLYSKEDKPVTVEDVKEIEALLSGPPIVGDNPVFTLKVDSHRGINLDYVITDEIEPDATLEAIYAEKDEVELRKTKKINELQRLDRKEKHPETVAEVKKLREEYLSKSDEVYYYKRHGERYVVGLDSAHPDDGAVITDLYNGGAFAESLPRDKFLLFGKIKNRRSDLSKYKGRLKKAKTDASKAQQLKNISQAEIEINIMDQMLGTL